VAADLRAASLRAGSAAEADLVPRLNRLRHLRAVPANPDWGTGLPQPEAEDSGKLLQVSTNADRAQSLQRLPLPYATALRMRDAGISDDVIAECIGVDVDALPTFMRVAEAKLAAAAAGERSTSP
jgi:DNA-directed RNA polymerase specialized sigma24 family protein